MRNSTRKMLALAGAVLFLAAGCAAKGPVWPAITESPTDVRIQGRWIWAELFAENAETEKAFYGEVFGWQFDSHGTGTGSYAVVRADGRPVAGILQFPKQDGAARSARWMPIMSVPDTARAAEHASALGGKVVIPARKLQGRGETSVLADPEGAIFGVIHTDAGDPPDVFPAHNTWLWVELWARNALRMADFYRPLGAYEVTHHEGPGDRTELHLVAGGYPRAGVLQIERKDLPSAWLPYIRVKDLQKTVADIERAGGRIVVAPAPEIRNGKVAVFLDPLGAAAAVAEWADESAGEGKP